MSETTGTEDVGERDAEQEDPAIAGQPEIPAGEKQEPTGRLEEREQRQHGMQQHGDTFAVDSDEPTDTSGIEQSSARTGSEHSPATSLPNAEPPGTSNDD